MTATQTFNFITGGKEGFDLGVAEHGKAVDDDGGIADHGDYLFGFEFFIGVVADGEDNGIDAFE